MVKTLEMAVSYLSHCYNICLDGFRKIAQISETWPRIEPQIGSVSADQWTWYYDDSDEI